MQSLLLPNPSLRGLFLAVSTPSGPQLVFNYPPHPNTFNHPTFGPADNGETPWYVELLLLSDELALISEEFGLLGVAGSDSASSKPARTKPRRLLGRRNHRTSPVRHASDFPLEPHDADEDEYGEVDAAGDADSNTVFGFEPLFLAELAHPPAAMCNQRFELAVDDTVFLGLPVHVDEDGQWKRRKHPAPRLRLHHTSNNTPAPEDTTPPLTPVLPLFPPPSPRPASGLFLDAPGGRESTPQAPAPAMSMFHVVFVMNPPIGEHNQRLDDMFQYVVLRLALVLRNEQARSGYVWRECLIMARTRELHAALNAPIGDLWAQMLEQLLLAKALSKCYHAILTLQIADLVINNKLRLFQIPIRTEYAHLPPPTASIIKGLYLLLLRALERMVLAADPNSGGSSGGAGAEEDHEDEVQWFALLLLDEPDQIVRDIDVDRNSILATFIRTIRPTESIAQLAQQSGLHLSQVLLFAAHLIGWRRARAIVPLLTRHTYIVLPMAPVQQLSNDLVVFKNRFRLLPLLAHFLTLLLASKPRPYSGIVPSRDHRELYLDALEWLICHGYVSQLHTFLWLKVGPTVKVMVDEEMEHRERGKRSTAAKVPGGWSTTDNSSKAPAMPEMPETLSAVPLPVDTLPGGAVRALEPEGDTIILDPARALRLERMWIQKCVEGRKPEMVALFYRLLKYFDGRHPFEMVMVREGVLRQELRQLLVVIEDYVVSVRHW